MSSTASPTRLSWKNTGPSGISDHNGNMVPNYEVVLPEGTYNIRATDNNTRRFSGYLVTFKSKEGHIRHLSTHTRRAKWAKEMAANDYRLLRGHPVRSRFRRKGIVAA
jgi:hypothetical protein